MPSAVTRSLRRGDLDLGVSFDYPEIGDTFGDDLALVHLLDDPFDVVVPRGHGLEGEQTIRFADLGGENWLLGDFGADSPSFRMIDRRCRDAGFDRVSPIASTTARWRRRSSPQEKGSHSCHV